MNFVLAGIIVTSMGLINMGVALNTANDKFSGMDNVIKYGTRVAAVLFPFIGGYFFGVALPDILSCPATGS